MYEIQGGRHHSARARLRHRPACYTIVLHANTNPVAARGLGGRRQRAGDLWWEWRWVGGGMASAAWWTAPLAEFFGVSDKPSKKREYKREVRPVHCATRPKSSGSGRHSPVRDPASMPRAIREAPCSEVPLPGSDHPSELRERYAIHSKAGKGAYGCVFTATDITTGQDVALKCIQDVFRTTEDAKRALREAAILRQCDHPNIIGFRKVLRPPNGEDFSQLWIVLDRCDWDLKSVLTMKMKAWTNTHVEHLLHQILCGLAYLHDNGIVHRDLKPANILVTRDCEVRIADFGLSRQIQETDRNDQWPPQTEAFGEGQQMTPPKILDMPAGGLARTLSRRVVTRYYRAPELLLGSETYDAAIDIWSLGCIFAEMLHSLAPSTFDTSASAVLFPGESGDEYPSARSLPSELRKCRSMLRLQFDTLGLPSTVDVDSLTEDRDMRRSIHRCCVRMEEQEREMFGVVDDRPTEERLQERFPHAPTSAIQLLALMLRYSPKERPRASECVCEGPKHNFQDMLLCWRRSPELAPPVTQARCEMSFPFEDRRQNRQSLRQLILEEVGAEAPATLAAAMSKPFATGSPTSTFPAGSSSSPSFSSDRCCAKQEDGDLAGYSPTICDSDTDDSSYAGKVARRVGTVAWRCRPAEVPSGSEARNRATMRATRVNTTGRERERDR